MQILGYKRYSLNIIKNTIEQLEFEISNLNKNIKIDKQNNIPNDIVLLKQKKSNALIKFKLAQQTGNSKHHTLFSLPIGKSNYYYIFRKSELEREKSFLERKVTKNKSFDKEIKHINKEIDEIKTKLSLFNLNTFIWIKL